MEDTNTTVAYATQEKFIELANQWHEEYGYLKLKSFFDTENTSTPTMLHKRFVVSKMISEFLIGNGVYPIARNVLTLIEACDELEEYSIEVPTEDTEPLEDDTFNYDTEYDEIDVERCDCV